MSILIVTVTHTSSCLNRRKSRLFQLNSQFNVPSPRKLLPEDVAMQAVLQKVAEDVTQRNGVGAISTLLGNEGIILPR